MALNHIPTKMSLPDPLRARRRGFQVCSIRKMGGSQCAAPKVGGHSPPIAGRETEAKRGNRLPIPCRKLLAEPGLAALSSNSRFNVFIFHDPLLSLKRQSGLHFVKESLCKGPVAGKTKASLKAVCDLMRQYCKGCV